MLELIGTENVKYISNKEMEMITELVNKEEEIKNMEKIKKYKN